MSVLIDTEYVVSVQPPTKLGYWKLHDGDITIHVTHRRPDLLNRFFMKLLLGWTWIDDA